MSESVFARLERLLNERGVPFSVLQHAPVFTSEQAAAVRGVPLGTGAKALVCKVDEGFALFVIPADRKLDSKKIRQTLRIRSLRFASRDELFDLTGLTSGAVPPFGSLFGLPTHCEQELARNETVNFNAGDHSISISLLAADYLRAEAPNLGSFTTSAS